MDPINLLFHVAGFLAPAVFLALALPLTARLMRPTGATTRSFGRQAALVFVAAGAVLAAGLWWYGRDGKMVTYAALIVTAATVQWLALRAWR